METERLHKSLMRIINHGWPAAGSPEKSWRSCLLSIHTIARKAIQDMKATPAPAPSVQLGDDVRGKTMSSTPLQCLGLIVSYLDKTLDEIDWRRLHGPREDTPENRCPSVNTAAMRMECQLTRYDFGIAEMSKESATNKEST